MTVRWKPLLILSGMFFVVAVVGVIAMAWTLVPRSADGVLKQARAAAVAGRFDDAVIYYKQALQFDAKSATIHEEFANLYRDWARSAPADRREALRTERLDHLMKAVKFDKNARGPKVQLLEAAMAQDGAAESVYWARQVLTVDPDNVDAHYVLALEELETRSPNVPDVKQHLESLDDNKAPAIRRALIRARVAQATGDEKGRDEAFAEARAIKLPEGASPIDGVARARIEAMEIQNAADPGKLEPRVKGLLKDVKDLTSSADVAAGRVTRLSQLLEQTQRVLAARSPKGPKGEPGANDALVDAIEQDLDAIFKKSLDTPQKADLQVYLTYADHLRFRQQRDRCLQVIDEALHTPAASRPANVTSAMGLHAVAVEMALSKQDDPARVEKAAPHLQALLASNEPRFQGMGHLFQGAIDLEQSGLVQSVPQAGGKAEPARVPQAKLRASALSHLKQAAAQLPGVAEAQARYGVALVLTGEQALGRQCLQNALRQGNLDSQYQFWAAWSILQAGYPEEAEPIVDSLFRQLAQGTIPAELKGTLHQISGELYQARRSPGDLERAAQEFDKAAALGQAADTGIALRQAQLEVQLGRHDEALARLERLRAGGQGGAAAENMAVLIYEEQGKKDEARKLLREARGRFPKAPELAGLEAAIATRDGKPEEADRVLKTFLADDPENVTLTLMRAQLLADSLKRPKDARAILQAMADRCDNSAPLVQLAQVEMEENDLAAAAATIAKIRSRWKEAATGDVLDGQLALKRSNIPLALQHFGEALKKDPDNKIVQFWKAQLDSRTGQVGEASKALEDLVKDRPTKEVDAGVTLMSAAQSALANLALQRGDPSDAIRRFEELKRNNEAGALGRSDRWQLITAYVLKGQWPVARRELASILNDEKNPPTDDERVRGANFYRQHKEDAAALAQLDYVLKVNPSNPGAVVTRSFIHLKAKKFDEAAAILRSGITLSEKKDKDKVPAVFYLMLAAVENEAPPAETATKRAAAVLEQGLATQPNSVELVQAEYLLLAPTDPKGAMGLVESRAKADPKGPYRRMLVDVLREQREYEKADKLLRELVQGSPDDVNLAAALVQVISLEAGEAAAAGNVEKRRALDEKAATMIAECRKRHPDDVTFLKAQCDLVARSGDWTRAIAVTKEIDKVSKTSGAGALIRARIFAQQEKTREAAKAFAESLDVNPRQPDVRLLLAQELIKLGEYDDAIKQARLVLDADKDRLDAMLVEARALAESGSGDAEKQAACQAAAERLEAAIAIEPGFLEAYHTLADAELKRGRREAAIAVYRRDLKANPQDNLGLAKLIQLLAGRGAAGEPASPGDLEEARRLADEVAAADKKGTMVLAAGVGFHKAGQLELALSLSEKAATMLDSPVAHLNLGDLLLSQAESQPDPARARPLFARAVEEYDRVLKVQPGLVEAVNNKAWVLHTYLGRSQEALELTQGLLKRVNAASLPGEFFDTLGAIQAAMGHDGDAEASYLRGLEKAPEHPVLNYHLGKLLAGSRTRSARAKGYLSKALAYRGQLAPEMARDAEQLAQQLGNPIRGN